MSADVPQGILTYHRRPPADCSPRIIDMIGRVNAQVLRETNGDAWTTEIIKESPRWHKRLLTELMHLMNVTEKFSKTLRSLKSCCYLCCPFGYEALSTDTL